MRMHLSLNPNSEVVPFDYQYQLIGTFQKWAVEHDIHDSISLYSMSWLKGGKITKDGFQFKDGAKWFISIHDIALFKSVMKQLLKDPTVSYGMSVSNVQIQETPTFPNKQRFVCETPILIKKNTDDNIEHVPYTSSEADELMTKTLKHKMDVAGIGNLSVTCKFDRSYNRAKQKVVTIKGIKNKANVCPVILEGDPEAISFAWDVGIGTLTGSTFGAIC